MLACSNCFSTHFNFRTTCDGALDTECCVVAHTYATKPHDRTTERAAVGIRDYGDQVENFNASSSWKIPSEKFDEVISNAREFITYAQNCCRSKNADQSQISSLASSLSSSIRAVVAMERESRAISAPKVVAAPALKSAPTPMPTQSYSKPSPSPTYSQTPKPTPVAAASSRVSDLFSDVVPVGYTPPPASEPAQAPTPYGNFSSIAAPKPAASTAADDELGKVDCDSRDTLTTHFAVADNLLDGLESAAPAMGGGGGGGGSDMGGGGASAAADELDALTADLGLLLHNVTLVHCLSSTCYCWSSSSSSSQVVAVAAVVAAAVAAVEVGDGLCRRRLLMDCFYRNQTMRFFVAF